MYSRKLQQKRKLKCAESWGSEVTVMFKRFACHQVLSSAGGGQLQLAARLRMNGCVASVEVQNWSWSWWFSREHRLLGKERETQLCSPAACNTLDLSKNRRLPNPTSRPLCCIQYVCLLPYLRKPANRRCWKNRCSHHCELAQVFVILEVLTAQDDFQKSRDGEKAKVHSRTAAAMHLHVERQPCSVRRLPCALMALCSIPLRCAITPPKQYVTHPRGDIDRLLRSSGPPIHKMHQASGHQGWLDYHSQPVCLYMSASSVIRNESKVSQGPTWGLQEQLSRLRKDGGNSNVAPTAQQDPGRSKIRVSVTGAALAHKIEQVHV